MFNLLNTNIKLLIIIALYLPVFSTYAENTDTLTVTYRGPVSANDTREFYYKELLELALEKTKSTRGNYKILQAPPMNQLRDAYAVDQQLYPNYIIDENYEDKFLKSNITYVNFPLDLGLTGVRICFVNPTIKEEIKAVKNVEELKKYTIGQGTGWADVEILRRNGFKVVTAQNYDGMFKMVAIGRFDLFCRGINELAKENESFKHIKNLTYDESFALVYALPRFFILNKKNAELKSRIEDGLHIAYLDGSFKILFQKYYGDSIEFANLRNRKIFRIDNPLIKGLSADYEQYLYKLQ